MHRQHPKLFKTTPKIKKPKADNPFERVDQARLCKWMTERELLYFAVPNDGKRSHGMALRAHATGLKAGVPDLCIPMPRAPHHGLYIELKRLRGGVVSPEQQYWIDVLRSQGYRAEICKGYDAAIAVLEDYFK